MDVFNNILVAFLCLCVCSWKTKSSLWSLFYSLPFQIIQQKKQMKYCKLVFLVKVGSEEPVFNFSSKEEPKEHKKWYQVDLISGFFIDKYKSLKHSVGVG